MRDKPYTVGIRADPLKLVKIEEVGWSRQLQRDGKGVLKKIEGRGSTGFSTAILYHHATNLLNCGAMIEKKAFRLLRKLPFV